MLGIALDGVGNKAGVDAVYKATGAKFPILSANLGHFAASYQALTGEAPMGAPTFMLFNPKDKLVGLNPGPLRIKALKRFIDQKSVA